MALKGEKVVAVIPARGGSKRCPNKNIRDFRGKPLIAWSIEAASKSKYIDLIVISTESDEIKSIARDYLPIDPKAIVHNRPKELAEDHSTNEEVLRNVLYARPDFDWIVLLQPTSPLRTAEDIDTCLEIAKKEGQGCVSFRESTQQKNGAVYVAHTNYIQRGFDFGRPFTRFYLMPEERSLDIDFAEEFNL